MTSLGALALTWLMAAGAATDGEIALRPAMGPYYAALVASGRGNIEATQRQLLLFSARWEKVAKAARTEVPAALRDDPAWGKALDHVAAALQRTRTALRIKDTGGAHAELESIRLRLREVRVHHGLETFDDRLTDFHEAMERLIARISARNEIVLTAADWDAIQPQLGIAERALGATETTVPEPIRNAASWKTGLQAVRNNLTQLDKAVAARDGFAASTAAETLHDRYYDLLLVLSKLG
jgi:hypothetical protein